MRWGKYNTCTAQRISWNVHELNTQVTAKGTCDFRPCVCSHVFVLWLLHRFMDIVSLTHQRKTPGAVHFCKYPSNFYSFTSLTHRLLLGAITVAEGIWNGPRSQGEKKICLFPSSVWYFLSQTTLYFRHLSACLHLSTDLSSLHTSTQTSRSSK